MNEQVYYYGSLAMLCSRLSVGSEASIDRLNTARKESRSKIRVSKSNEKEIERKGKRRKKERKKEKEETIFYYYPCLL